MWYRMKRFPARCGRGLKRPTRVVDLHIWRLGPGHCGVVVSLVADHPQTPAAYKARLAGIEGLSHVTIEVHRAGHHPQAAA